MAIRPIVTFDDDVLREEAQPVRENSEELQTLIDDMFETMYNADGVGLAAPQIGILKRIFVADADVLAEEKEEEDLVGPIAMINPKITVSGEETVTMDEGCLSIPDLTGPVSRPVTITITYRDRDFEEQQMEANGSLARVIQHEYDHLNGVLFIDHLSFFKRKLLSAKLAELAAGNKSIAYPVVAKTQ